MDTLALDGGASSSNCRLQYGNSTFYPELEYDSDSKVRIFNNLMAYAMRENDYITLVLSSILAIMKACIHLHFSICLFKQKK